MLTLYIAAVSILGFVLMGGDKARARTGSWRVPEKYLMLVALAGGSLGVFFGMRVFRHKIRHAMFAAGVPLILIAQAVLLIWLRKAGL
ncbi:MAG: DUF1294 domain-containing protein [Desulfocucumaceae bacterium]